MLSISFYMDWAFEEEVLQHLAAHVRAVSKTQEPEDIIITALNSSNYIQIRNTEIFKDQAFNSLKAELMSTSFSAYNYGGGDCGSYTLFLARLLMKMHYNVKIVQLKVNGTWGGHITLAVRNGDKLLLVDPLFNCPFRDSAGHLSDIHEVASNWAFYAKSLPANYNLDYNYQSGWRFTNWDKLGFLSRDAYKIGCFFFSKKKMDGVSLRTYFLGLSKDYFLMSLAAFITLILILFLSFQRKTKAIIRQRREEIKKKKRESYIPSDPSVI